MVSGPLQQSICLHCREAFHSPIIHVLCLGYLLGVHRILPKEAPVDGEQVLQGGKKGVVFFQHGFMQNSEVFILRGPHKSLPYILVDLGYAKHTTPHIII
jgi:hypothetical protein